MLPDITSSPAKVLSYLLLVREAGAAMAAKRKSDELSSARDRKKQRIAENRTIAVQQPSGPAIVHVPSNSTGTNAVAGPSKSVAFVGNEDSVPSRSIPLTGMP